MSSRKCASRSTTRITRAYLSERRHNIARGIDYIRLTATTGTYVRTAMRPQQFPVMMSDLLDGNCSPHFRVMGAAN